MNDLQARVLNEEQPQGFVIDSLEKAAWAFKKISACNARISEVKGYAENERTKIDEWENSETKSARDSIEYFKHLLADYYFAEKDKNPKFKLSTPYGNGYSRKNAPELAYDEASVDRLEAMGMSDCVKTTKTINKTVLKNSILITEDNKAVNSDGEVLDFITVMPKGESFILKGCD